MSTSHHNNLNLPATLPEGVPVSMPTLPPKLIIRTEQQLKAISDPFRSRILGIIQHQPATAKQIANRLGASPGTIGHHLHVLEAAGLAQVVARRLVRGTVAKYYTRTARIFINELMHDVAGTKERGLAAFAQAHEELAEAVGSGEYDPYRTDSFPHVRLSPERAQIYRDRLLSIVSDLLEEAPSPKGQVYSFLIAMFKSPTYLQVEPSSEGIEISGGAHETTDDK